MQVIRRHQAGLTRVFPHNGNNRYIIAHGPKRAPAPPVQQYIVFGPFEHEKSGLRFWIRVPEGAQTQAEAWEVGFDIDSDVDPDVWLPVYEVLEQLENGQKQSVRMRARGSGWPG